MLWDGQHGFKRLRFKPYWGEWMSERLQNPVGEVEIPYTRVCVNVDRTNVRIVSWNGAGAAFAVAAEKFGVCIQYLHPRHERVTSQLGQYRQFGQYQGGEINVLGGSARTEGEVDQFLQVATLYKPKVAVLMTPVGVEVDIERWGQFGLVDSARFGDVLGSMRQIGIIGLPTLKLLAGPLHTEYAKTIGDRYLDCGMHAVGDPRWIVDTHALQFSSGMEVGIRPAHGDIKLSLNSCIGVLCLADVKENNPKWPQVWGGEWRNTRSA